MKLLPLCRFALLAATIKSLSCQNPGPESPCPSGKCYSQNQENNIGMPLGPYLSYGCSELCTDLSMTFTFGKDKYFRAATKCSQAAQCNTVAQVPPADNKESNLACPACFSLSSTPCEGTLVKCPESEDQCVNITGIFREGSAKKLFYGRGCTTLAAKDLASGDTIATSQNSMLEILAINVQKATEKLFTCDDTTTQSKSCIGTKCYSQNQENTIVGESEQKYSLQTCLQSCTEGNIRFTFGENKYFRMATTCCGADKCNTIPAVPPTDEKESNLECPACFDFTSTPCEATWIKCPESEDQCVNITGTYHDASGKKPFYGTGCATTEAKTIVPGANIVTNKNSKFQVVTINVEKAKDSSWSVQGSFTVPLLLSGLIGIQLTNIF